MPTAARLISAIGFAAMGFYLAQVMPSYLPEADGYRYFAAICAAIGLVCGWMVTGTLAGKGYTAAIGSGIRTSVTAAVLAIVIFALYLMVMRALHHNYRGPTEALEGVVKISVDFAGVFHHVEMLEILLGGGVVIAWVTEWVSRRWS
ncbi:TrgA family protein [Thioclava sp. BHET1]|nr:TrgA family protein [Thioclava sp. BHET1]